MSNFINRTIKKTIKEVEKSFPVIMITGPRQVGKTTLLKIIKEESANELNYISLDDITTRKLAIEDPELFLRTYDAPLIIDEFQYAPNLLSYIKIIVDNKRFESLKDNNVKSNGIFFNVPNDLQCKSARTSINCCLQEGLFLWLTHLSI